MPRLNWTKAPQVNDLEQAILDGAVRAQRSYEDITGGWWLWHGPESFLQVEVAKHIAGETGHTVYVDSSIKKLHREMKRGPGRPSDNLGTRPDISVWYKTNDTIRAAVEIKRAWNSSVVQSDARKLERWLRQANAPQSAYLLVYSETKGENRDKGLSTRFRNWEDKLGWSLVGSAIDPEGDGEWAWGICLLRRNR